MGLFNSEGAGEACAYSAPASNRALPPMPSSATARQHAIVGGDRAPAAKVINLANVGDTPFDPWVGLTEKQFGPGCRHNDDASLYSLVHDGAPERSSDCMCDM